MSEDIRIEPDYDALFALFMRDAKLYTNSLVRDAKTTTLRGVEILRAVQNILAPLNVAIQAATTMNAVLAFRSGLSEIVTLIDTTANTMDNAAED